MTAQLLSGRALAKTMKEALAVQVAALRASGVAPTLAVLRLGDDKAAAGYARAIEKNCASVGVDFRAEVMDVDVTQAAAEAALQKLNDDANVHGIMILEPAPNQINMDSLVMRLKPDKDIDGVHPVNAGRLAAQRAGDAPRRRQDPLRQGGGQERKGGRPSALHPARRHIARRRARAALFGDRGPR